MDHWFLLTLLFLTALISTFILVSMLLIARYKKHILNKKFSDIKKEFGEILNSDVLLTETGNIYLFPKLVIDEQKIKFKYYSSAEEYWYSDDVYVFMDAPTFHHFKHAVRWCNGYPIRETLALIEFKKLFDSFIVKFKKTSIDNPLVDGLQFTGFKLTKNEIVIKDVSISLNAGTLLYTVRKYFNPTSFERRWDNLNRFLNEAENQITNIVRNDAVFKRAVNELINGTVDKKRFQKGDPVIILSGALTAKSNINAKFVKWLKPVEYQTDLVQGPLDCVVAIENKGIIKTFSGYLIQKES